MSNSSVEQEKARAKRFAKDDGVENPKAIRSSLFALIFVVGVPITSFITKPDSLVQKVVGLPLKLIPGTASISADRIIPALACIYGFWTFGATGAFSVTGQAMSRPEGLDGNHPRQFRAGLRGLPLRLVSAHENLMENFPIFAVAAGLTQLLAPSNQQVINLLGLHVFLKLFVYYPSYLANIGPLRSFAHLTANSAAINVLYRLALGAK